MENSINCHGKVMELCYEILNPVSCIAMFQGMALSLGDKINMSQKKAKQGGA